MRKPKTREEKALELLSMISSEEVSDISDDVFLICGSLDILYLESLNKFRGNEKMSPDVFEKLTLESAYLISLFAEKYGPLLTKINKKYPKYWQELCTEELDDELIKNEG
jgi:hypothetical protein